MTANQSIKKLVVLIHQLKNKMFHQHKYTISLPGATLMLLLSSLIIYTSCRTDEPKNTNSKNNPYKGIEENTDHSTGSSEEEYYFQFISLGAQSISTEKGSTKIFFDCNQEYTVDISGNISGLYVIPTSGYGKGYVTAYYDNVKYNSRVSWSESGDLIFTVKEGTPKEYTIVKKRFNLFRVGNKMDI